MFSLPDAQRSKQTLPIRINFTMQTQLIFGYGRPM